jgi:SAM-dependent methyltransferase
MNIDWDLLLFSPFFITVKLLRNALRREFGGQDLGAVLDVGCGDKPYRDCLTYKSYIGIEVERSMNVDVLCDGGVLPFRDGCFDTVICIAVLEHVREPGRQMREMARVLKKRGRLIVVAPFFWNLHYEPNDYYRFTKYGLQHLFLKCNIDPDKTIPLEGKIGLAHGLFADCVFRNVNKRFGQASRWVRVMLYQAILLPLAVLLYPIAKFEYGRDAPIKQGYLVTGLKR